MPILRGGTKPITGIVRPEDRILTPTGTGTTTLPTVGGTITRGTVPQGGGEFVTTAGGFMLPDQFVPPKTQSASAGNLAARLQIPDLQNPPLQPPVGMPQNNGQTQITLPDAYRQNPNGMYPPLTIRNGVTMPSASPGVKPQTFPGMNWADFLTVAHYR